MISFQISYQRYFVLLLLTAGLLTTHRATAQKTNNYSVKGWWGPPPPPFSPVVQKDRHITFRIKAAHAAKVELLFGEWNIKPVPMQKDSAGTWCVTIPPVAPGIYSYVFSVDGVQTVDKANPVTKSGTELYSSMVEVPGDRPRFDEIQNVPHGVKQLIRYTSTPLRRLRAMTVYLPPQYDTHLTEKFPVLYLRHGGGDNETSWSQPAGRADIILENLLAAQKAAPMIIVMTNGLTDGTWAGGSTPEGMKALEEELLVDVIPLVEHRFRVKKQAGARAIAGLSMGGGQSLVIGLRHPELFSWIGEFSSGLLSDKDFNMDTQWPGIMNASLNKRVKLLWIGCGTDDPRFPGHLDLVNNLQKRNIHYQFATVPGGHEWRVWRVSLHGFLQKIFREPVVYSKETLQL